MSVLLAATMCAGSPTSFAFEKLEDESWPEDAPPVPLYCANDATADEDTIQTKNKLTDEEQVRTYFQPKNVFHIIPPFEPNEGEDGKILHYPECAPVWKELFDALLADQYEKKKGFIGRMGAAREEIKKDPLGMGFFMPAPGPGPGVTFIPSEGFARAMGQVWKLFEVELDPIPDIRDATDELGRPPGLSALELANALQIPSWIPEELSELAPSVHLESLIRGDEHRAVFERRALLKAILEPVILNSAEKAFLPDAERNRFRDRVWRLARDWTALKSWIEKVKDKELEREKKTGAPSPVLVVVRELEESALNKHERDTYGGGTDREILRGISAVFHVSDYADRVGVWEELGPKVWNLSPEARAKIEGYKRDKATLIMSLKLLTSSSAMSAMSNALSLSTIPMIDFKPEISPYTDTFWEIYDDPLIRHIANHVDHYESTQLQTHRDVQDAIRLANYALLFYGGFYYIPKKGAEKLALWAASRASTAGRIVTAPLRNQFVSELTLDFWLTFASMNVELAAEFFEKWENRRNRGILVFWDHEKEILYYSAAGALGIIAGNRLMGMKQLRRLLGDKMDEAAKEALQ